MSQLKKRSVAASFLFKFPHNDTALPPQVALFRRSGDVRTYQHKYAPISGSVEQTDASPVETAWREIHEETSLDSTSIRLFRQGKPYVFRDDSIGREWTINPFAFTLSLDPDAANAAIKLDWEHESYAWFELEELLASEDDFPSGVPKLLESLRRVWFEADLGSDAGKVLREGLERLQADHESGARVLASKALEVFTQMMTALERDTTADWWRKVRLAGWHLWKNGRESMGASVLSVVLSSLATIEMHLPEPGTSMSSETLQRCLKDIEALEERRKSSSANIGLGLATYINTTFPPDDAQQPLRILTLSSSSTITHSLNTLATKCSRPLQIHILESRPLFEGVTMANRIGNSANCRVRIYTDACAAVAARGVHLVLLGADLIDAAGNVSNKTGSLPAVLAAKHVAPAAKVVVVAEREKVLPFAPPAHDEENDPREVTSTWENSVASAEGVDVKNVYFEWVPASMVDRYVTEDGMLEAQDVGRLAEDGRARAAKLFDGI